MEVLHDRSVCRCVILGDPRSGKSIALRNFALQWAKRSDSVRDECDFPILVELKEYQFVKEADSKLTLSDLIANGGSGDYRMGISTLRARMKCPRHVLVMLDGLDGLDELCDSCELVLQEIRKFINEFISGTVRIVITSRIVGYKLSDLIGQDFKKLIVAG